MNAGGSNSEREQPGGGSEETLRELKLVVPEDLYRAWHRCSWLLVAETGKTRTEIMRDMIVDFLKQHGC